MLRSSMMNGERRGMHDCFCLNLWIYCMVCFLTKMLAEPECVQIGRVYGRI